MRIALVCPASLPATQFGGILFLAVDIASELSREGHSVTIYTTDLDFANNPKFFNKKLPRIQKINNFLIKRSHVWFSYKLFFVNPSIFFQLIKDKPEIIHTIGVRSFQSIAAALASKKLTVPLIISDQGGLTTHPDLKESSNLTKFSYMLQKPVINFIIKQSTKISVANEYEKEIFNQFNAKNKTVIVRNGINLEQFNIIENKFREKYDFQDKFILFVGRFHKVKGIDILLRSIELIKNELNQKNIKLVIMGVDFGFESKMFEMINNLKINNIVKVIKKPPRDDVLCAYQKSEFLVLPSRWELSPLTPLEGFAFRKTVISTNVHGIPSTIDNEKNGILIDYEDYEQLSKKILELLENTDKREKLSNEGYKLVNDACNSKMMATQTLKIYQDVLNQQVE
jgi:glycosyltransferase involved in cell wall biosynthesis